VNLTYCALALLSGAAIAAAGCAMDQRAHRTPSANSKPTLFDTDSSASSTSAAHATTPDQAAIADHLQELEHKIAQLENRLARGQGALRNGPNRLVDGGANESVLERLRRVEAELADHKMVVTTKNTEITILHDQLQQMSSRSSTLAAESDSLSHVRDHLVTAQQELAARKATITTLDQQIAATELQRLRIEQQYFTTVAGILRLIPGQSQELLDLQSLIRRQIKTFQIEKGTP
jgi:chromosome segregation ATPase